MPLITITRGSLGATSELAEIISKKLNCKYITREEGLNHAKKYGIDETGLTGGIMEKQPPHFWDRQAANRRRYLIYLKAALLDLMIDGNVVYSGHLAQFILSDVPKLLRVRVDASMRIRVNHLMKQQNLTEEAAVAQIKEIDSRRNSWTKFLYGVEFSDPTNFDVILNRDRMSLETMAAAVIAIVERPEFKLDGHTLRILKDVHLKAVINAHLARSARTQGIEATIECDAQSGEVKISGMAPLVGTETWVNDIKEVVSLVAGVAKVEVVARA